MVYGLRRNLPLVAWFGLSGWRRWALPMPSVRVAGVVSLLSGVSPCTRPIASSRRRPLGSERHWPRRTSPTSRCRSSKSNLGLRVG